MNWAFSHNLSGLAMKLVLWVAVLLAPLRESMFAVGMLVIADLVTGIAAAHRRGEKIKSFSLGRTPYKLVWYNVGILSAYALEYVTSGVPAVKVMAGLIGLTEFKSIAENLSDITGVDFSSVVTRFQGTKTPPEPREPPTT